ncbi:hypothetical protein ABS71_05870 [bacterium SCN 62-11]|nr:MAG: hypothetical protein ABS71_05870 [bacterium SCN 62-11]
MNKALFIILLTAASWAVPPKKGADPMPPISLLLDSKTVSLGVVHARPDDEGFKSLFNTAWDSIKTRTGGSGSALDLVSNFLGRSSTNILMQFLPFQMVRIDHFEEQGHDKASFMLTLSGFQGLQGIFYSGLLNGPDGKPYETEKIGKEVVVIRAKPGQKREEALVVNRVQGTFYGFADLETAHRVLEKKTTPNPDLAKNLGLVNQDQDTYGVLLNRQNSVLRFFEWANRRDFEAIKTAIGEEKLNKLFEHVTLVTWTGDLISDDRMDMQVRWRTDTPESCEALEDALSTARKTLAERGRTGEIRLTTVDTEVLLDIQFTGYRKMLQDYIARP